MTCRSAILLLAGLVFSSPSQADDTSDRRLGLKKFAQDTFQAKPDDQCEAFALVAEFAARKTPDSASLWMEDMRLVIIGTDWLRHAGKRGEYYMGTRTTDTGFKAELKDSSPQAEHAMAAIVLGKALPPGLSDMAQHFVEFTSNGVKEQVSAADHLLWALGADIGARLSNSNLGKVGTPIRRTMCD